MLQHGWEAQFKNPYSNTTTDMCQKQTSRPFLGQSKLLVHIASLPQLPPQLVVTPLPALCTIHQLSPSALPPTVPATASSSPHLSSTLPMADEPELRLTVFVISAFSLLQNSLLNTSACSLKASSASCWHTQAVVALQTNSVWCQQISVYGSTSGSILWLQQQHA